MQEVGRAGRGGFEPCSVQILYADAQLLTERRFKSTDTDEPSCRDTTALLTDPACSRQQLCHRYSDPATEGAAQRFAYLADAAGGLIEMVPMSIVDPVGFAAHHAIDAPPSAFNGLRVHHPPEALLVSARFFDLASWQHTIDHVGADGTYITVQTSATQKAVMPVVKTPCGMGWMPAEKMRVHTNDFHGVEMNSYASMTDVRADAAARAVAAGAVAAAAAVTADAAAEDAAFRSFCQRVAFPTMSNNHIAFASAAPIITLLANGAVSPLRQIFLIKPAATHLPSQHTATTTRSEETASSSSSSSKTQITTTVFCTTSTIGNLPITRTLTATLRSCTLQAAPTAAESAAPPKTKLVKSAEWSVSFAGGEAPKAKSSRGALVGATNLPFEVLPRSHEAENVAHFHAATRPLVANAAAATLVAGAGAGAAAAPAPAPAPALAPARCGCGNCDADVITLQREFALSLMRSIIGTLETARVPLVMPALVRLAMEHAKRSHGAHIAAFKRQIHALTGTSGELTLTVMRAFVRYMVSVGMLHSSLSAQLVSEHFLLHGTHAPGGAHGAHGAAAAAPAAAAAAFAAADDDGNDEQEEAAAAATSAADAAAAKKKSDKRAEKRYFVVRYSVRGSLDEQRALSSVLRALHESPVFQHRVLVLCPVWLARTLCHCESSHALKKSAMRSADDDDEEDEDEDEDDDHDGDHGDNAGGNGVDGNEARADGVDAVEMVIDDAAQVAAHGEMNADADAAADAILADADNGHAVAGHAAAPPGDGIADAAIAIAGVDAVNTDPYYRVYAAANTR